MPTPADALRVLVADDHALYRRGLVAQLETTNDLEVVAESNSGDDVVELASSFAPDVILMDVHISGIGGIEATRRLIEANPAARVLMLSASDDADDLIDVVEAGAAGYLLKKTSTAEIGESVRRVASGESVVSPALMSRLFDEFASMAQRLRAAPVAEVSERLLTNREVVVLRTMAEGADNAAIAAANEMTEHAARGHVSDILEKLQLASRTEAVLYAVRTRLVDP